ncbi:MAG: CRISPR-associated protein Cas4 [Christensenellales bacterium]|jgi:CRISPR-associated exonuclease Cas4
MVTADTTDYLPLSGIQHFSFCRRRWALIHIEQQWQENVLTAEGRIQHEVVHQEGTGAKRRDILLTHGLRIISHALRLQGACDAVEFHADPDGVSLHGREGLWRPFPVEFKHGRAGTSTQADSLQLCAQAMCLEEMLLCDVPQGALFYQTTRRREVISFTPELRARVTDMAQEMNELFARGHTPRVRRRPVCKSCSLRDLCLPQLEAKPSAAQYIATSLRDIGQDSDLSFPTNT